MDGVFASGVHAYRYYGMLGLRLVLAPKVAVGT
jgi:hypothetical protein